MEAVAEMARWIRLAVMAAVMVLLVQGEYPWGRGRGVLYLGVVCSLGLRGLLDAGLSDRVYLLV